MNLARNQPLKLNPPYINSANAMTFPIEEILARRTRFAESMKNNSLAIFAAANEQTRSRDTEYPFRQDSDFYYLTGFNEPDALFLLLKKDNKLQSILFSRSKDKMAEIWHGRRLGQDAAIKQLKMDMAYPNEVVCDELHLIFNGLDTVYYTFGHAELESLLRETLAKLRNGARQQWRAPGKLVDCSFELHEQRLFKSSYEIAALRQASLISADAHVRAMKFCRPGIFEYQLEAEIHHEFTMRGARYPAYGTIVGGGVNACILHYTENTDTLKSGDLVLIDAGAEFAGYAGDITRTFPVNGRFSPEQKTLYQLVLDAQLLALDILKPGSSIKDANDKVVRLFVETLTSLEILKGDVEALIEEGAHKAFYMHGLSHWLGLDVHDVGDYKSVKRDRPLEAGMVITVEPGLYIDQDADVPPQWRGIAIRIEDDVLITADGCEIMTSGVPKSVEEIESLVGSAEKADIAQVRVK